MGFSYKTLRETLPPWFCHRSGMPDIIVGMMGRLVRNLSGHAFPGWSTAEGRKAVADILLPLVQNAPGFRNVRHAEMTELDYATRRALMERRQISPCMAARQDGCHLLLNQKQNTVVMINEEEHLAIHSFVSGFDAYSLLTRLHRLPNELKETVAFAYDEHYGYLTSLPQEAGDGIQLYVVLHLPALALANMTSQINRSVEKLELNIAPYYPQLGEECGNMFVLYTNPIPQGALEDVLAHLLDIIETLQERELQVRNKLAKLPQSGDFFVLDAINRSYGLLQYARAISAAEWADALSMLRLGVEFGYISAEDADKDTLLAELAELALRGSDYADATEPAPRPHPRYPSAPELARSAAIRPFLNHTTLHTAPGAGAELPFSL